MNKNTIALFLMLALFGIGTVGANAQDVPLIKVAGFVKRKLLLDAAAIRTMPVHRLPGFRLINDKGEVKRKFASARSVLLADIVEKAGVNIEQHKEQGKYYIVVNASDGYQVVFGYDEIMYGAKAAAAYLLLELDGKPLGTIADPYIMACPGDRLTGPRFIKMVQEIEVLKI